MLWHTGGPESAKDEGADIIAGLQQETGQIADPSERLSAYGRIANEYRGKDDAVSKTVAEWAAAQQTVTRLGMVREQVRSLSKGPEREALLADMIAMGENSPNPAVREEYAWALKEYAVEAATDDETILRLDEVISRFGNDASVSSDVHTSWAMSRKVLASKEADAREEALKTLVARFGGNANSQIRYSVANAVVNAANAAPDKPERERRFREVLEKYGPVKDPALEPILAFAETRLAKLTKDPAERERLYRSSLDRTRGNTQTHMKRYYEDAVAGLYDTLSNPRDKTAFFVSEVEKNGDIVATESFPNFIQIVKYHLAPDEKGAIYENLLQKYGSRDEPALGQAMALVLFAKADNTPSRREKIGIYDQILQKFDVQADRRDDVARAMERKASLLEDHAEAERLYRAVLEAYPSDGGRHLPDHVARAATQLAELTGDSADSISFYNRYLSDATEPPFRAALVLQIAELTEDKTQKLQLYEEILDAYEDGEIGIAGKVPSAISGIEAILNETGSKREKELFYSRVANLYPDADSFLNKRAVERLAALGGQTNLQNYFNRNIVSAEEELVATLMEQARFTEASDGRIALYDKAIWLLENMSSPARFQKLSNVLLAKADAMDSPADKLLILDQIIADRRSEATSDSDVDSAYSRKLDIVSDPAEKMAVVDEFMEWFIERNGFDIAAWLFFRTLDLAKDPAERSARLDRFADTMKDWNWKDKDIASAQLLLSQAKSSGTEARLAVIDGILDKYGDDTRLFTKDLMAQAVREKAELTGDDSVITRYYAGQMAFAKSAASKAEIRLKMAASYAVPESRIRKYDAILAEYSGGDDESSRQIVLEAMFRKAEDTADDDAKTGIYNDILAKIGEGIDTRSTKLRIRTYEALAASAKNAEEKTRFYGEALREAEAMDLYQGFDHIRKIREELEKITPEEK